MKRIVNVRHAKAVPYGYEHDFSRDLTDRGIRDAQKISFHIKSLGIAPDLIISSPANRAYQTAAIFAGNLGYPESEILKEKRLYMDFTTGEFISYIQDLPDDLQTVFVFGHNPGMSFYTEKLAGSFVGDMPTCSTVGIDFIVDEWQQVESRSGRVAFHYYPKMFR